MRYLLKSVMVILCVLSGINFAKADWKQAHELCDLGINAFCNSPIGYVKTGRSLFGGFETMGGEVLALYLNNNNKATRARVYITKVDNRHEGYCHKIYEFNSDDVVFGGNNVNRLVTIHECP